MAFSIRCAIATIAFLGPNRVRRIWLEPNHGKIIQNQRNSDGNHLHRDESGEVAEIFVFCPIFLAYSLDNDSL